MINFIVLFVVTICVALPVSAEQPKSTDEITVSVSGQGEVLAAPDIAIISGSLVQQGDDSTALLKIVSTKMEDVIKVLKSKGIPPADIQAGQVRINQNWQRQNGRNEPSGYNAQRPITVSVRDIDDYPQIIDAMSSAGVNTLNNVSFDFSKRQQLTDRALTVAATNATHKANILGNALKADRCTPVQVSSGAQHVPLPRMEVAMLKAGDSSYNPGDQTIRAEVNATFICSRQ